MMMALKKRWRHEELELVIYVSPVLRCDFVSRHFYRSAAPNVLLEVIHRKIDSYDPAHAGVVFAELTAELVREPDLTIEVVIGGSALSLGWNWSELLRLCSDLSQRVGVPVITDMIAVVEELRAIGGSVVVVHRLAGVNDEQIENFLQSAGIECLGVISDPAAPDVNVASSLSDGAIQASRLAGEALERHPEAGTVLLLGGSWWIDEAVEIIVASGRSCVNNLEAIANRHAERIDNS